MAAGSLTPQLSDGDGYGQQACSPGRLLELKLLVQELWQAQGLSKLLPQVPWLGPTWPPQPQNGLS